MASNSKQNEKKDAALEAKPYSADTENKMVKKQNQAFKKRLVLLFVKIAFLGFVCFMIFGVIFGFTRMNDNSMYPSIGNGDLLIYYRLEGKYSNGDPVVVNRGKGDMVYRIVAQPGQTVDIKDGKLLVDDQPSTVNVFFDTEKDEKTAMPYPYTVPEGTYFVMNDFRKDTDDSRKFGQISKDEIKGRIITKIQIRDL